MGRQADHHHQKLHHLVCSEAAAFHQKGCDPERNKEELTTGGSGRTGSPCVTQVLETVPSKGRQGVSRHTALGLHSPAVRTLHSQRRRHEFNPWSGNQDPACQAQSKEKKKNTQAHDPSCYKPVSKPKNRTDPAKQPNFSQLRKISIHVNATHSKYCCC